MSEFLVLVGGIAWVFIVMTLAGYSSVLVVAKRWEAGIVGFACTIMIIALGVLAIIYAPYIAQTWVWD